MIDKLKHAVALLASFEEAMPHHDAIYETVNGDWGTTDEGYRKMPPLLRSSLSWRKAVDPEKLKQFEGLVHFLKEAIFGVDCDNDSAVSVIVIDRGRDQRRGMNFKVPRISDKPTFKEIMTARDCASTNAKIAQGIVDDIERELKFFMEDNKALFEQEGKLE